MSEQQDEMTRQERREKRLDKKKERMPQHGRGMAQMYKQAVEKRIGPSHEEKDRKKGIEHKGKH